MLSIQDALRVGPSAANEPMTYPELERHLAMLVNILPAILREQTAARDELEFHAAASAFRQACDELAMLAATNELVAARTNNAEQLFFFQQPVQRYSEQLYGSVD